jgi:hypothetical protein
VAIAKYLLEDLSNGWSSYASDPVDGFTLAYLIGAGAEMIFRSKMRATVGFQTAMPLGQDDGYRAMMANTFQGEQIADIQKMVTNFLLPNINFLPQFHYYPGHSGQTSLPAKKSFKLPPGSSLILGEFETLINSAAKKSSWGSDISGNDSVTARLNAIKNKGADWAFPWSADDRQEYSRYDQPTRDQYKAFQPY